jgi:anaerobic magnesium-protoporphyrin IX monomethyl ester cyclase
MHERAKISLVNPPPLKGVYRHQPYLPLGLAYLAAVLEEKGHEVTVIDCPALEMNNEKLKAKLASTEPDVIGITSMTPTIESALLSAHTVKETCPKATIVLGGPHATFMDKKVLAEEQAVDIIARGEGEQTLLELSQNVSNPKALIKIE